MIVKCPKCRFKFDTPVDEGINEVACVCPRCGTPFMYQVSDALEPSPEETEAPSAPAAEALDETDTMPAASVSAERAPQADRPADIFGMRQGGRRPMSAADRQNNPMNMRSCMRGCLIGFLLLFIVSVFIVRNCLGERSYKQAMIEQGINESLTEFGDEAIVKDYEPFLVEGAEPVPDWLQGTWRTDLDDGYVVIIIRGNKISEESGGQISRGTFFYKKKRLYCKFEGSEEVEHRKVDPKRQCIIYNGVEMEKE